MGSILKCQQIHEESFADFMTLEFGTDRLSRNIGDELQLYAE